MCQLRARCQAEEQEYKDLDNWQAVMAVLAAYDCEEGEERMVDAVHAWVEKWTLRIGTLLRLSAEGVVCLESQEIEETQIKKQGKLSSTSSTKRTARYVQQQEHRGTMMR